MKAFGTFMLLALVLGVLSVPTGQIRAQDTLVVEWQNPDLTIKINALLDAFQGDTINRPEGRVYKLKKGGYYALTETIDNTGRPLRLVGEAAGPTELENPPVLQIYTRQDGSRTGRMIAVWDDLTLKNLWITGITDLGDQTTYQPIQVDGSGLTIIVDNCIFDRTNFAPIAFQNGTNCKVYYTNNTFRNLIERSITQQWTGRGISVWADQDTFVVENNTFFNVGCFPFQMENGAIKYLRFNHNTLVNIGRGFAGNWWREGYFTNNLWINPFWHGEGASDYTSSGRDPRAYSSGIWNIGPLPSNYGPEQGRRILFGFNAAWRDPVFSTSGYYDDTVRAQYFIGDVTRLDFLEGKPYETMTVRDTVWLSQRPNMPTQPDSLNLKMWRTMDSLRSGVSVTNVANSYWYELVFYEGQELHTAVSWPRTEDFSYTTPSNLLTAGTDHLPLGDLNWFPAAKSQFEANKAAYLDTLHSLAGIPPTFEPVASYQAEHGTLGGDAAIETVTGFTYFYMESGKFRWEFDLPTAGQYDLNVLTHMRGNDTRGQHTRINGYAIHDSAWGWGELIYSNAATGPGGDPNPHAGMPINEWTWVLWTADMLKTADRPALTMPAGANTIEIASSWGWQNFSQINLITAGTADTVIRLTAPDVAYYEVVQPRVEPAVPWTPAYFKSVNMNTAGTVTWDINPDAAMKYTLQIFYQNYGSPQTGSIQVDGSTVVDNVSFSANTDSTGLNVLAPYFDLVAGAHTLTLTAAGIRVDFVQLTKVIPAVSVPPDGLPYAYSLDQNYPNPFNPTTQINFSLAKPSNVRLEVFNILGQRVTTLIDTRMDAGPHTVRFDARNYATGVYFYRLEAGDFRDHKKMLLLK